MGATEHLQAVLTASVKQVAILLSLVQVAFCPFHTNYVQIVCEVQHQEHQQILLGKSFQI